MLTTVDYIFQSFRLSDEEYAELDRRFGDLCHFVAWQLKKKNSRNNLTDELEDIAQELRWAIIRAGVYYKRQVYLEDCMKAVKDSVQDVLLCSILSELEYLWENRTRHGANKQKFGEYQERLLEVMTTKLVPDADRPDKCRHLRVDNKFATYCKAIAWNCQKNLGKKITRERHIRSGLVSLSQHDYLVGADSEV